MLGGSHVHYLPVEEGIVRPRNVDHLVAEAVLHRRSIDAGAVLAERHSVGLEVERAGIEEHEVALAGVERDQRRVRQVVGVALGVLSEGQEVVLRRADDQHRHGDLGERLLA